MMGNVWEWNETQVSSSARGLRGGSFNDEYYYYGDFRMSSSRDGVYQYVEYLDIGFRVASVPEPCSLALLFIGGLVLRSRK